VKALWSLVARTAARVNNHPVWVVFAVVVTALGIILTFLGIVRGSQGQSPASPPAQSTIGRGSTPTPAPVNGSEPESSIGLCFTGSDEVPCDTEHQLEVFSDQPCSRESMVSFLGGSPLIEVLIASVGPVEKNIGRRPVCVVYPPQDASATRSAAGILQTTLGDSWRICVDDRIETQVACSVPHTGEVVYVGRPSGGDSLNCLRRAEEYLEAPLQRFSFQLSAEMIEVDGESGCAVAVLGANELTESIRAIGTSTLPIAAR